MAGTKISDLLDIWAAYQQIYDIDTTNGPPFSSARDLYNTIDSMEVGDVAWQAFSVEFDGEISGDEIPPWKKKSYEVWFRDPLKIVEAQIANKDYARKMDYVPKQMFSRAEKRQYSDFMSGNWAWEQAVRCFSILLCMYIYATVIQRRTSSQKIWRPMDQCWYLSFSEATRQQFL